jgi:RNA-directed DNA polymerase
VSPILANVYLHYTLDLWFHEVVKWHSRGEACLIRYADDCVPRARMVARLCRA